MDSSREEELLVALQKKEKESAELNQSLVQAASAGQDLLSENERLKKLVQQMSALGPNFWDAAGASAPLSATASQRTSPRPSITSLETPASSHTGHTPGQHHALSVATLAVPSLSSGRGFARTPPGSPTASSTAFRRKRQNTEESWEADGRERREMEEERRQLRGELATVQAQLETERQARHAAEVAEARARQGLATDVSLNVLHAEPVPVLAQAASEDSLLVESEQLRKLEVCVRKSVKEDYQEELDDLARTREVGLVEANRLRAQLDAKSQALGESNDQVMHLISQVTSYSRRLEDAEAAQAELQKNKELNQIKESAMTMRRSITEMRRRSSMLQGMQVMRSIASQGAVSWDRSSLFDQLQPFSLHDSEEVASMQREQEELLGEVEDLRSQLEEMQQAHQAALAAAAGQPLSAAPASFSSSGGGDAAAGGEARVRATMNASLSFEVQPTQAIAAADPQDDGEEHGGVAEVIAALQQELEQARRDAVEASEELTRQRAAAQEATVLHVEEEEEEEEVGFLAGLSRAMASLVCCQKKHRPAGSDFLKAMREQDFAAED